MKQIMYALTIVSIFFLSSCGSSDNGSKTDSGDNKSSADATKANVPTMTVDEASWIATDLSTVAPRVHVSMKLPKDVKKEKNGNGGVDVHINDWYDITISNNASNSVKEAMNDDKSLSINKKESYINGKLLVDEPNGFVCTYQMKDEANGTKYQPEAHFVFYLEKDGAIYSIQDARPLSNYSIAGSAYSEAIAKQIYNLVKGSAKII
jgi:hypothetical protein